MDKMRMWQEIVTIKATFQEIVVIRLHHLYPLKKRCKGE
jgi:hypothetical protein